MLQNIWILIVKCCYTAWTDVEYARKCRVHEEWASGCYTSYQCTCQFIFFNSRRFLSDLENKYTTVNDLHLCFISSGKNELYGLNSSSVKLDRVRNIYQNKHALSVKRYTRLYSDSGYLSGDAFVRSSRRISRIRFGAEKGNYLTVRVAISCLWKILMHGIRSLLPVQLRLFARIILILRENVNITLCSIDKIGETEMSPYSCCPLVEMLGILRLLCLPCFPPFSLHISPTSFFSRAHFVVSNGPFLLLYTSPRSSFLVPHIFTLNSIANLFSFT
jgi:hypothetical protein